MSLSKEQDSRARRILDGTTPTTLLRRFLRVTRRHRAALAFSACLAASVCGQEPTEPATPEPLSIPLPILDPSPRVPPFDEPTRSEDTPTLPTDAPTAEEMVAPVLGETISREEQVRSNKWRVIPFGRAMVTADDNVFITSTAQQKDVYFTLTPGIAIGWGNYEKDLKALGEFAHYFELPDFELERQVRNFVFVKYSPTVTLFSQFHDQNSFDQDALVAGRWEFTKLTLGARVRFQTLSGVDFNTNHRDNRQLLTSVFTSSYDFSEKTSLEVNVNNDTYNYQNRTVGQTLEDSSETVVEEWINYQWMPKTSVSVGGRVGFLELQTSPSQTYEQLRVRAIYNATGKLGIEINGGAEFRQVKNGNGSNPFSVFSFGGFYKPFDGTTVSASAFRQNTAAINDPGSNITSTGISASIKQRFFQRFYFEIQGSYRNSKYVSNTAGASSGRTDNYFLAKSSISFDVTKHLSAEVAYEHIQDDSTQSISSFAGNLVTAQVNLRF